MGTRLVFLDSSVLVAILSGEDDAPIWSRRLAETNDILTSPLVVLETVMRLSTKLDLHPGLAMTFVNTALQEANVTVAHITEADGTAAIDAFARYGKGRGHPAQLNMADCMAYACARNRGVKLLYKGNDFAATDLA